MHIRHNYADNDRRFKIVYLPPHVLLNCLINTEREPNMTCVKVSLDDVPVGTKVVDRYYDHARGAEGIVLYNRIWDSIPLGESIPQLYTSHTYVEVKMNEPNYRTTQPIRSDVVPNLLEPGDFNNLTTALKQVSKVDKKPLMMNVTEKVGDKVTNQFTVEPRVGTFTISDSKGNSQTCENKITTNPALLSSYDPAKQETRVTDPATGAFNIIKDIHQQRLGICQPVSEQALNQIAKSLEDELFDPTLGVPHDIPNEQRMARLDDNNPFDKTWRDKPPML